LADFAHGDRSGSNTDRRQPYAPAARLQNIRPSVQATVEVLGL